MIHLPYSGFQFIVSFQDISCFYYGSWLIVGYLIVSQHYILRIYRSKHLVVIHRKVLNLLSCSKSYQIHYAIQWVLYFRSLTKNLSTNLLKNTPEVGNLCGNYISKRYAIKSSSACSTSQLLSEHTRRVYLEHAN